MNNSPDSIPDPKRFLQLLNGLPREYDSTAWFAQLKGILLQLLDGIDRVSVFANKSIGLGAEEQNWGRFFSKTGPLQTSYPDAFANESFVVAEPEEVETYPEINGLTGMMAILYDKMKREEPMVSDYQEPVAFEYRTDDDRHLGGIFLWRHLSKPPIPQSTVDFMAGLHDFMMFALEDLIARVEFQRPLLRGICSAMARLVKNANLLDHEARCLGYMMVGLTYDQVADRMKISVNTARKYIMSVYRKAGVHSLSHLFATHFMPWSELDP